MSRQRSTSVSVGGSGGGVGILTIVGAGLAGWASYSLGNAPGWIAIHAIFNWFYLLYLCGGCGGGLPSGMWG